MLVLVFGGCASSDQEIVNEESGAIEQTPLPEGEILHLFGQTSQTTEAVSLKSPAAINVFYRQDCDMFILRMLNANEALAAAPGGTIFFAAWPGPHDYVERDPESPVPPFEYIPGEYVFDVEVEGTCNWEFWVELVGPE